MKVGDIPMPSSHQINSDKNYELEASEGEISDTNSFSMDESINNVIEQELLKKDNSVKIVDSVAFKRELLVPIVNNNVQLLRENILNNEKVYGCMKKQNGHVESTVVITSKNIDRKPIIRRKWNDDDENFDKKRRRVDENNMTRRPLNRLVSPPPCCDATRRRRALRHAVSPWYLENYAADIELSCVKKSSLSSRRNICLKKRDRRSPTRRGLVRSHQRESTNYNSSHIYDSVDSSESTCSSSSSISSLVSSASYSESVSLSKKRSYSPSLAISKSISKFHSSSPSSTSISKSLSSSKSISKSPSTSISKSPSSSISKSLSLSTSISTSSSLSKSSRTYSSLESPKSPDESVSDFTKKNQAVLPDAPNVYLKSLKDVIDKINIAYKSVFSQIPDKKSLPALAVCNIPLPRESSPLCLQADVPNCSDTIQQDTDNHIANEHDDIVAQPSSNAVKTQSNSTEAKEIVQIANSTAKSKTIGTPPCSSSVSSIAGSPGYSETSSGPPPPKISCLRIDYSNIEPSLLNRGCHDFLVNNARCHCTMPSPDQWKEGVRACGRGQTCLLRHLKIECNRTRCPTEVLCCNRQFQELDRSSSHCNDVELYYDKSQTSTYTLRTKKAAAKGALLFEVGGTACRSRGDQQSEQAQTRSDILVMRGVSVPLRSDRESLVHYLRHGGLESANVRIEKWLVDGRVRVGVFASCDIGRRTELVLSYHYDCLNVLHEADLGESEESVLLTLQSLLHDSATEENLLCLLDKLLSPEIAGSVLQWFTRLGGVSIVLALSVGYLSAKGCNETLLVKLVHLMSVSPRDADGDVDVLGVVTRVFLVHLAELAHSLGPRHHWSMVALEEESRRSEALSQGRVGTSCSEKSTLQCRLPTFWRSRECGEKRRVCFYHEVTKAQQWDMPVYPWDGNEDDDAHVFDYDGASLFPISLAAVSAAVQRDLELAPARRSGAESVESAPLDAKDFSDLCRKELFRKRMLEFIVPVLQPYREAQCRSGRITSDDDMRYLANKLTRTVMSKELRILNNVSHLLKVTPSVENKTKAYVLTYLQSRGSTYRRPSHKPLTAKKKPA